MPYDSTLYHKGIPYPFCKRCGNALLPMEETIVAPCTLCLDTNVAPPGDALLVRGRYWLERELKMVPVHIWVCEMHLQEIEQERIQYPNNWSLIQTWRALQEEILKQRGVY